MTEALKIRLEDLVQENSVIHFSDMLGPRLISLEKCESCGDPCEGVNPVDLNPENVRYGVEALGLKVIKKNLPELWPSEDGGYVCRHCLDELHHEQNEDSLLEANEGE